jgi:hypothetical protein
MLASGHAGAAGAAPRWHSVPGHGEAREHRGVEADPTRARRRKKRESGASQRHGLQAPTMAARAERTKPMAITCSVDGGGEHEGAEWREANWSGGDTLQRSSAVAAMAPRRYCYSDRRSPPFLFRLPAQ